MRSSSGPARGAWAGAISWTTGQPAKWSAVRALPCGEPMPYPYTLAEGTLVQAEGSSEVYEIRTDSAGRQVKARVDGNVNWDEVACVTRGWLDRY